MNCFCRHRLKVHPKCETAWAFKTQRQREKEGKKCPGYLLPLSALNRQSRGNHVTIFKVGIGNRLKVMCPRKLGTDCYTSTFSALLCFLSMFVLKIFIMSPDLLLYFSYSRVFLESLLQRLQVLSSFLFFPNSSSNLFWRTFFLFSCIFLSLYRIRSNVKFPLSRI